MKRGMEPFLVLNRTISSKSVVVEIEEVCVCVCVHCRRHFVESLYLYGD